MVDRRNLTMRDMGVAVAILVVSLLVVVGAMGGISFGNGTDNGTAPTADVIGGFASAGTALKAPVVVPQGLPSTWRGNSYSLVDPATQGGGGVAVARGGWLTETGKFITLIQSPADATALVSQEVGQGLASKGTADAGGAIWNVFPGQRQEPVWVRVHGGITLLITGSAGLDDFQVLAAAVA